MNKIRAILNISRPVNLLITFISIVVAGLIASPVNEISIYVLLAAVSGALIGAGGNIVNDIFDIEIDKVNRPERALPSGKLTVSNARILYFAATGVGLLISALINLSAALIASAAVLMILIYSATLKKIPLVGNFIVSFFTGMVFIYGAVAAGNWVAGLIPAGFGLMINMIREIVKDIEDIAGDSAHRVITFPAKFGTDAAVKLIVALIIVLMILTTLPFAFRIYKIEYFVVVMPLVNGLFVYIIKELIHDSSSKNLRKVSNLIKLNMVFGLIAIYLGN